jgi:CubicO group peptidase (beta-lactamase class C family)
VRTAGVGDSGGADHRPVDASTRFEIGSVAKPLTGMLLAELAARARVDPQAPLRTLLPRIRFEDPAVGAVTLAELASHRSGLPRLPFGPLALSGRAASIRGDDPYADYGPDAVIAAVAGSEAEGRGEVAYSNLGMAVLGQALAARAGTSYADLLDREILSPLGMDATTVVAGGAQPPSPSAQGRAANGTATAPWRGSGYTPAGNGVLSTADDMARLVAGAMERSAPGAAATEPRFARDEDDRIGFGWFIRRRGGREITWHNGRTGGFGSFVGFDRAAGRGVVVLANTNRSVDAAGFRLLGVAEEDDGPGPLPLLLTVVGALGAGLIPLEFVLRRRGSRWRTPPDRLRLVTSLVWGVAALVLVHRLGSWDAVPPVIWSVGAALLAAAAGLGAMRWRRLPLIAGGTRWARWAGSCASAAGSLAILVLVLVLV